MKNLMFLLAMLTAATLIGQDLDWIGDPEDFLPPDDFTISYSDFDCTNDFDGCLWIGVLDGEIVKESWGWEVLENVHWEGGCDVEVVYSHLPCSDVIDNLDQNPIPELVDSRQTAVFSTEVCVTLRDKCDGFELNYCFTVTVECGACSEPFEPYCSSCKEAMTPVEEGGCFYCDATELEYGVNSCVEPCEDPSCPQLAAPQPKLLCGQRGAIPTNISWFSFVATTTFVNVEVWIYNCVGAGVEVGIYASCDFNEPCVGFAANCITGNSNFRAELILGETYYLFIDGCNGSVCDYELTVDGLEPSYLDALDYLTAYSPCRQEDLTADFSNGAGSGSMYAECQVADRIVVEPNEPIVFKAYHQGDLGFYREYDDICSTYPPNVDFDFFMEYQLGRIMGIQSVKVK